MTKWWKCDLQVATPAWKFKMPTGEHYDLETDAGRRSFAVRYMDVLVERGIEVVALADHNSGEWIDLMVEEGARKGIIVFPGCEITTGTGSDGIHLIVIGDRAKTSRDFDVLLGGTLGFMEPNFPRYHDHGNGNRIPGSSEKTIGKILDDLSDDYLVIAPHALGDNGIASGNTAQGDIRWRALHHPRLVAVDPGEDGGSGEEAFNRNFRSRNLEHFPRLKDLAFVATSDAYSLDMLGSNYSWIRMEEPSLEGLRQAFLDHEARIICSWDSRLRDYRDGNPNNVRHSWIGSLSLDGALGNSSCPLSLAFHPALNVIIGGRGSGKSTVVAAIRQLYSGTQTLPESVRDEAESFSEVVFQDANISAEHFIQNSQERQRATWSLANGKYTETAGSERVPTSFAVRVVNQKELFERVSRDRHDPLAASRSFLAFLDEGLGLLRTNSPKADSWWRRFQDAGQSWMVKTTDFLRLEQDLTQLPAVRAKIKEIGAQVVALDSPEAKARREANDASIRERKFLAEREGLLKEFVSDIKSVLQREPADAILEGSGEKFKALVAGLDGIERELVGNVEAAIYGAETELTTWRNDADSSDWSSDVKTAEMDNEKYLAELQSKGIDPNAYSGLKEQLASQQTIERSLAALDGKRPVVQAERDAAWRRIEDLIAERRNTRNDLLREVSERSGKLRFNLIPYKDVIGWSTTVRELLSLRSDAFLEDVPQLAKWLWEGTEDELTERWSKWREALASGNFDTLFGKDKPISRADWMKRLEKLDPTIRLRLAFEVADDSVEIAFLKDGGDPCAISDWQDITQGSPGQRTAAMLGFVLHHGDEPLILDQPEDDLDTEWISNLVVSELRGSRWKRQLIVVTHNANIPVNGDAERVLILENKSGAIRLRTSTRTSDGHESVHCGAIERSEIRTDIQNIMEGGIRAFIQRERKYGYEGKG